MIRFLLPDLWNWCTRKMPDLYTPPPGLSLLSPQAPVQGGLHDTQLIYTPWGATLHPMVCISVGCGVNLLVHVACFSTLPAPVLSWLLTARTSQEALRTHQLSPCTNPPSTKRHAMGTVHQFSPCTNPPSTKKHSSSLNSAQTSIVALRVSTIHPEAFKQLVPSLNINSRHA